MKILNITAQKPNSTGSGIYLTEMVHNWKRMGHEQAVVAGVYEDDFSFLPLGTTFYPVFFQSEKLPFAIVGMSDEMPYESTKYQDLSGERFEQFCGAFRETLKKAVDEFQPDMIICHHLYLLTALAREWYPDIKMAGICHGSDLRQICKNELHRAYIQQQIPKLDKIVALHEAQKKEIIDRYGCNEKQVYTIGVGYNRNIFYKEEKREKSCQQLVFAGKVTEKKGIFSLLRSLERLTDAPDKLTVKIAGGFGGREECEKILELAGKSKYQIEFLGVRTQRELAEIFRQSDVFVLPSFFEGLPLVTMEAMACGCKVVCSEIPGMKKWLDKNVPGHQVEFVALPKMETVDEPEKEELEQFEQRLADALQKKLAQQEEETPNMLGISWEGISRKVLSMMI